MGIVKVRLFEETDNLVSRSRLNGLVAPLVTEFNGNIDNDNIKADASISSSKLDLTSISKPLNFLPTLPSHVDNGDIWFTGEHFKCRINDKIHIINSTEV